MKKQYLIPSQRNVAVAACLFALGGVTSTAYAELDLNFQPVDPAKLYRSSESSPPAIDIMCMPGTAYDISSCVRGDASSGNHSQDPDTTPFYMERIVDNNLGYYHVLIGDPESSFSQEYYISFAGIIQWPNNYQMTSSAGSYNGGSDAQPSNNFGQGAFSDPLGSDTTKTGNGTANPERVVFRQTLQDTYMEQEVLKAVKANKPKITQTINDNEMSSTFILDMSALGYNDASAAGIMTNTMLVTDSQSGLVMTNFDINTTSQNSYVSGGKYKYNFPTSGMWMDKSFGTYTYAPGAGFDVHSVNWAAFSDPTVNIPNY